MTSDPKCPECGAVLTPEQAAGGACPRCEMRIALRESADPAEPAEPGADGGELAERIGPYRVIRRLGEGGMGVVYLAEQQQPIRREVAVKVIKRGMDTAHVVKRFEQERQALALMDHPAIAQVFEAGATEQGRPYFVMEYVDGEPITDYADRREMSLPERMELFARVCAGVQHAHQKGVIHRDLKPSNVLVASREDEAIPKIIDFGVAKATSKRLTEETLFTELGVMIGTPEYMSPEQAEVSVLDVDTRTDVYSLGVLLYELLTGVLPFDPVELRRAGHEEIRRRIREEEPAMPSSRVSTLGDEAAEAARTRRVDTPSLCRSLRGDLDWIVLKCLAKEPERRYGSPAELAADLRRHLTHEPVVARPPSAIYKTRKFVRRNRLLVAASAAVLVTLIAGIVGTTTFALREGRQRQATDDALADLQQVVDFQQGMLSDIDVEAMGRRLASRLRGRIPEEQAAIEFDRSLAAVNLTDAALDLLDEEILGRATEEASKRFSDRPDVEERLRKSLGSTYYEIGLLERAAAEYERRYELSNGRDPSAANDLGRLYWKTGRSADAEPLLLEALEGLRARHGEQDVDVAGAMTNLGLVCESLGRFDEAIDWHTKALAMYRDTVGPEHKHTLRGMNYLASAYQHSDRAKEGEHIDRALELYEESVALAERVFGEDHADTMMTLSNYATVLYQQNRFDEAIEVAERVLEHSRRTRGASHYTTIQQTLNLAGNYDSAGRRQDAERYYREALALVLDRYGAMDRFAAMTEGELAKFLFRTERPGEGVEHLEAALRANPVVYGEIHPKTLLDLMLARAVYMDVLGDRSEYEPGLRHTCERLLEALRREGAGVGVPNAWLYTEARKIMFDYPQDLRDYDVALRLARLIDETTGSENHHYLGLLAWAQHLTGDHPAAVETQKKALERIPEDNPDQRSEFEESLARFEAALAANRG